MRSSTFSLRAPDGSELFAYRWLPETLPRAAVQIAHGLFEHAGRYIQLAEALTRAGYAVYAGDHRGHGRTAQSAEQLGCFAERDGWRKCLGDFWQLNRRIIVEHPTLPVVLIGQSMGSLMVLHFLGEHPEAVRGVVLAGMIGRPARLALAGMIAQIERLRLGPRGMSPIVQALSCGGFNRRFEPRRTEADWLSRDPGEVDKYLADPLCRFRPSVQLWLDVLQAMNGIADPARWARIPKRLPIYLIAGTEDPVAGSGLEQLLSAFRAAGLQLVTHRFYPGARHALFSETNRYEVTDELLAWLHETTGRRRSLQDGRSRRARRGPWA